jgi:hypothetical protein
LNAANLFAFQKGMRELGYVGGQNLLLDYRSADGRAERFPSLAAELVDLKVDVIVTRGAAASLAAKQATATIPIVMAAHGDPLSSGLIASLARPGGNITGLSTLALDLYPKRVELLRDMIPTLRRISGVFNKENPLMLREWEEVVKSARSLGITADLMEVRNRDGLRPRLMPQAHGESKPSWSERRRLRNRTRSLSSSSPWGIGFQQCIHPASLSTPEDCWRTESAILTFITARPPTWTKS